MMRIVFGVVLGLLVAYPALLSLLLGVVAQPPVLAFAAGVLLWPRITRRVRGWAR
ncbi:hypothetical protein [Streptomyces sp. NPDC096132]|uniref:hypothetical protein n=1 Tax=Streptomyces sp. NPDC096132 TaxID=3366075 RepID=UPI003817255A